MILKERRISLGITILPRSSIRLTIPVAFIFILLILYFLLLYFAHLILINTSLPLLFFGKKTDFYSFIKIWFYPFVFQTVYYVLILF